MTTISLLFFSIVLTVSSASAQWTNWNMVFSNSVDHPVGVAAWSASPKYRHALRTNQIPATLSWEVVTNWTASPFTSTTLLGWSGVENPNVVTHYENGWVVSNLVATVEWKGGKHHVIIESHPHGMVTRSYTIKQVKVYKP